MSQNNQNKIDFNHPDFSGIVSQYGITTNEFISFVSNLEEKIDFKINPSLFDSENPPGKIHIPNSYVSFAYYCKALDKEGVDVTNLLREFKAAQKTTNFTDILHAASLARLGFNLHIKGLKVLFTSLSKIEGDKNPDFHVNGIKAELKAPISNLLKETGGGKTESFIIEEGRVNIDKTLDEAIKKLLHNKLSEAVKQGDIIFFDCGEAIPPFEGLALNSGLNEVIPEIVKNRVILYKTKHFTPNINTKNTYHNGKNGETSFTAIPPDLDYFFGISKKFDDLVEFF